EGGRFVRVDVAAFEGHVAGVANVRIDGEGVALGDGAREVELRALVPSAAAVEVRVGREGEDEEPFGDAAVRAAHRAGLYAYDAARMVESPAKTTLRGTAVEVLGVLALYAAAVAYIRPWGDFSVTDDTYFGLPALELARTGRFHWTFAPHSLRAQIL